MGNWTTYHGPLHDRDFPFVTAYFDESGHSSSTRVVSMGGAMAGPKQWGEVRRKWRSSLDKFGIDIFHMTDFENRRGEFLGWDEGRKRALLKDLIDSIADVFVIIGAAAVVEDFKHVKTHVGPLMFSDPWYFCYQSCFEDALSTVLIFRAEEWGLEKDHANIRACFFEAHRQYKWGPILFSLANERNGEQEIQRPSGITSGIIGWGGKQSSVHFQLADLIAYELRKHVENAVFKGGRPTRWPMKQLLTKMFMANIFDNSRTPIPSEGSKTTAFRTASLNDIGEMGRIRFQQLPPITSP